MWRAATLKDWMARRGTGTSGGVRPVVEEIIERVREDGDRALRELTLKFDAVSLEDIAVSEDEREAAYEKIDRSLLDSLLEAEARITRFHELSVPRELWLEEVEPGITLGVKTTPMDRVGAYIPGGRAAYASSALMCAIPARVAGVNSLCCCSPPPIAPLTLVAMDIAGFDEIYSVGGAQAIAAMALGTESIRPVQKIVGPGNVYVTMAKMLLREHVEIDFPAGPSEIVILADDSSRPDFIASDLLAQAEHDPMAACLLVCTDDSLPSRVGEYLRAQFVDAKR
ncbi:MAG: histidinol dehydrogenase, partial [Methanolinea sp.]|nr:histidinol dehydrogenase [Methanolinea sp.]